MKRFWLFALVVGLILTQLFSQSITAQEVTESARYEADARDLLARMTPAQRVGQLFLIPVPGDTLAPEDDVYELLADYEVGGVVLQAENNNFQNVDDLPQSTAVFINRLQSVSLTGAITPTTATVGTQPAVPLLVATHHAGNGHSQILSGVTELPSLLAVGATWDANQATAVGQVAGRELAGMGFNLLLGPSLDVADQPDLLAVNGLEADTFGGNPFWVGRMGRAYINGVRQGGNGRVAVIGTLFPGRGSSDRAPHDEIAAVRKPLVQLQQTELVPFAAVVSSDDSTTAVVDGFMTAPIRYQGLQSNIQSTTPPFSLDPQAVDVLLRREPFISWRLNGGLLLSDGLGVDAIRRFYAAGGGEFPHRLVAKDALLAGNDLLYAADFSPQAGEDYATQAATIRDTITWFEERYETDQAFRERVDTAVVRILQTKLRLYDGDWSPEQVLVDETAVAELVEQGRSAMFTVAQEAITLLSPSPAELQERMPSPPNAEEQVVIFTDVQQVRQCLRCAPQAKLAVTELEQRMISLYGPEASGQVAPAQIDSYTLDHLADFLAQPAPIPAPQPISPTVTADGDVLPEAERPIETPLPYLVQQSLGTADWIIVAVHDDAAPLKRLLAERPELWRDRQLVVLSLGVPVDLDTTEVSKLTAYLGVYSSSSSFVDTAVRAIFRDVPLRGAPPISLEAIGYDLARAVQPAADQIIVLRIEPPTERDEPLEEGPLELLPGDTLRLQTGTILDRNGHLVPDGTLVQFTQEDRVQGFFNVIAEVPTRNGRAIYDYVLEARPGQYRLRASAGPATASEEVDIVIGENESASVVVITPTSAPTETPTPTPTPTVTPTGTPEPTPTPTAVVVDERPSEPQILITLTDGMHLAGLMGGLLIVGVMGSLMRRRSVARLTVTAWGVNMGLLVYIYELLGGLGVLEAWGMWAGFVAVLLGGVVGVLAGWVRTRPTAEPS